MYVDNVVLYQVNKSDDAATTINTSTTTANTTTTTVTTETPKIDKNTDWLGLNSVQLLVIALVIIVAILLLFFLIYRYVIKGLKQNSHSARLNNKSVSGSIAESKERNIFAYPERQMAVDQSTRGSPTSSTSANDSDHSLNQAAQPTNHLSTPAQNPTNQQTAAHGPPQIRVHKSATDPNQILSKPPAPPEKTQSRKSNSDSKRRRHSQADSHDPNSMAGALANIRDTLKEIEGKK